MMSATDLAGLITALGGALGAIVAATFTARGRREARRDQEAANRLREREQEQNYWKAQVDDQRVLLDRARADEQRARDELAQVRAEINEVREQARTQQREAHAALGGLADTIRVLQAVVHSEVAAAAAGKAVDDAEQHISDYAD
jgi:septal ring factor EnvC (AmiA/AmiB activator)